VADGELRMVDMPNSGLPGAEGPPSQQAKMIVFGVSFTTAKEGFREYWAQYGELAECELMFGRDGRYIYASALWCSCLCSLSIPPIFCAALHFCRAWLTTASTMCMAGTDRVDSGSSCTATRRSTSAS